MEYQKKKKIVRSHRYAQGEQNLLLNLENTDFKVVHQQISIKKKLLVDG